MDEARMDPDPAPCRVEVLSWEDVRVVVMTGEFDIDHLSGLREALDPLAPGVSRYVLDVTGVTFTDSTALSLMLQPALKPAGDPGGRAAPAPGPAPGTDRRRPGVHHGALRGGGPGDGRPAARGPGLS